jgi:hypothetical protein
MFSLINHELYAQTKGSSAGSVIKKRERGRSLIRVIRVIVAGACLRVATYQLSFANEYTSVSRAT